MSPTQLVLAALVYAFCVFRALVYVRRDEKLVERMHAHGMKANPMASWFAVAAIVLGPVTVLLGILVTPARHRLYQQLGMRPRKQPQLRLVPTKTEAA